MTEEQGAIEIRERGIEHGGRDVLMGLDGMRPTTTTAHTRTTKVLHGRHIEYDSRDTRIQARCCDGLSPTLTLTDDEDALAIPFGLLRHEVDGPQQTQVHATEIIGLAIGCIVIEIVAQLPVFQHTVIGIGLSVQHAMGIEIEAEGPTAKGGIAHTLAHLTTAPGATHTRCTTQDDDRQRTLRSIGWLGHIGPYGSRTETVNLDVVADVFPLILLWHVERSLLHLHGQRPQQCLLVVPIVHQIGWLLITGPETLRGHHKADALRFALATHLEADGTGAVDGGIEEGDHCTLRADTFLALKLIVTTDANGE